MKKLILLLPFLIVACSQKKSSEMEKAEKELEQIKNISSDYSHKTDSASLAKGDSLLRANGK